MDKIEKAAENYCLAAGFDSKQIISSCYGIKYKRLKEIFIAGATSPEAKEFHTREMYNEEEVWLFLQDHQMDFVETKSKIGLKEKKK